MRAANLIVLLMPIAVACATRRDTGNAMVVGGAVVATGAGMSSGRMVCGGGACAMQGSKTGAAVAAAGVGMAIAGHAIAESARRESAFAPRPASSEEHAPRYWNLVRPDDPDAAAPASSAPPATSAAPRATP
jgi:hypothetical protein